MTTNDVTLVSGTDQPLPANEATSQRALRSQPIGPGSYTWRGLGDRRGLLYLGTAGTLQNMHPAVSGALEDHSNFFTNPLDRLFRSLPPIMGVVYDSPSEGTGVQVRNFHKGLKGVDEQGNRYHALTPDTFWWTHVTFFWVIIDFEERFGAKRLSRAEKDQIVQEGVTWWRRYELSDRPVFDDYQSLCAYMDTMLDEVLTDTYTTKWAKNVNSAKLPSPPGVNPVVWKIAAPLVTAILEWLNKALLPEKARNILGMPWTRLDKILYRGLALSIRLVNLFWPYLPMRVRFMPRAYKAIRKHGL
ncbi:MAG: oxygenase MpaB family protein [Mycobacteriaceae bacterium]